MQITRATKRKGVLVGALKFRVESVHLTRRGQVVSLASEGNLTKVRGLNGVSVHGELIKVNVDKLGVRGHGHHGSQRGSQGKELHDDCSDRFFGRLVVKYSFLGRVQIVRSGKGDARCSASTKLERELVDKTILEKKSFCVSESKLPTNNIIAYELAGPMPKGTDELKY